MSDKKYRNGIREIKRIERIPRYKETTVCSLLDKPFKIADSASFLSSYNAIILREMYKFKSDNSHPYIIDCGANIGLSVFYFKKLYPDSTVIAFEPDKKIFDILSFNVGELNNVTLINKGLWDEETTLKFFEEGGDGGRIVDDKDKSGNIIEIKTTRLKQYLNKPVDFLKIDIEGAEYKVLRDCENELKNVKNLFIEYHSFVNRPQEMGELLYIISKAGFRYYVENNGIYSYSPFFQIKTYAGFDNQSNIFAYRK
jgi:FkbM family methyltransferase